MFKIGDKVSVLDEAVDGVIVAIKASQVVIETTEGFMLEYAMTDLILVQKSNPLDGIQNAHISSIIKEKEWVKPNYTAVKERKNKHENGVPEFDLHIEKLVKNKNGMSNYDILTLQSDTAKRHIEFAIRNRIPKIVLIHGVGEGILKAELDFMLGRYDNIRYHDANYQKYGLGATEVFISNGAKND
jgi:dsDNA-specific endonuclease/ATPase MutS2